MTLFNFQLRSLAFVSPWGNPDQPRLHWFGLTDGWYWLQLNEDNEFFRYSSDLLAHWQKNYPEEPTYLPYADYYVVRLWEDILEVLPDILEPLPPKLAQMLETEEQVNQWRECIQLWEKAFGIGENVEEEENEKEETEEDKAEWEIFLQATMWWHDRKLSAHPLTAPPSLWFWNDGQDIHGFWDNSQRCIQDIPAWSAQKGHIQLPYAQFLEEVGSFHTRFFAEMEERIQDAKRAWPHPGVEVDFDELKKGQQDRFQWLAQSLERAASRVATDWNAVIDAMRTMDEIAGIHINS